MHNVVTRKVGQRPALRPRSPTTSGCTGPGPFPNPRLETMCSLLKFYEHEHGEPVHRPKLAERNRLADLRTFVGDFGANYGSSRPALQQAIPAIFDHRPGRLCVMLAFFDFLRGGVPASYFLFADPLKSPKNRSTEFCRPPITIQFNLRPFADLACLPYGCAPGCDDASTIPAANADFGLSGHARLWNSMT